MIDLGLVQEIDYYTGLMFRGYMGGAGSPVLAGGRYDNLCAKFGRDIPATGFAIDIDALSESVDLKKKLFRRSWYSAKEAISRAHSIISIQTVNWHRWHRVTPKRKQWSWQRKRAIAPS